MYIDTPSLSVSTLNVIYTPLSPLSPPPPPPQIHAEAKAEEQRTLHMVAQHQMTTQFKPPMRGDDKRGRRDNKVGPWHEYRETRVLLCCVCK